nr:Os05g0170250 [Ipomoea batatas]
MILAVNTMATMITATATSDGSHFLCCPLDSEQDSSGGPHSIRFPFPPKNEANGNLAKFSGSCPWRWLYERSRITCSSVSEPSPRGIEPFRTYREVRFPSSGGIGPDNRLVWRESLSNVEHFPSSGGTVPLKLLDDRYSSPRSCRFPNHLGISPANWLLLRRRWRSCFSPESSEPTSPVSLLKDKSRKLRFFNRPISGGMLPERRLYARRRRLRLFALDRPDGTVPEKLLLVRSKRVRKSEVQSGEIFPVSLLFEKFTMLRFLRLWNNSGIGPSSELFLVFEASCSSLSLVGFGQISHSVLTGEAGDPLASQSWREWSPRGGSRRNRSLVSSSSSSAPTGYSPRSGCHRGGIVPVNLLVLSKRSVRLPRFPTSGGIPPEKAFPERSSCWRDEHSSSSSGKLPER